MNSIAKKGISAFLAVLAAVMLGACSGGEKRESIPMITTVEPTAAPTTAAPEVDEIEEMVAAMTLEQKVGQMFFVRCPDENAVEAV